ncbi:MAG: carbohydrate porin [Phycisphaerales bacterium]|nr:carbohydrate porin [Phycisphaerales bacterium]
MVIRNGLLVLFGLALIVEAGQQAQGTPPSGPAPAGFTIPELTLEPTRIALVADTAQTAPAMDELPPQAATPKSVPYNLLTTPKLTGDWFGLRTTLKDVGVDFSPMLVSVYQQNFRGGVNTHNAHEIAGMWFYNMELDFNKMLSIPGASFFIRGTQSWNNGIQRDVGSLAAPYWIAGSGGNYFYGDPNCILVDKWWYRQRLLDDRIEFRLGKLLNVLDLFDQNLYAQSYVTQFSYRGFSHNLTIPAAKGIGAFAKFWPADWIYFQMSGIDADNRPTRTGFDTGFHGPAHFVGNWEFGLSPKWRIGDRTLPGNYRFGWWYNPRVRSVYMKTLDGALTQRYKSGDVGFYTSLDQLIFKENDNPSDKQGLGAFFRYGYAHGDINRINHFWSTGLQYQGLIPTRDEDLLGFGVAQSIASRQLRSEINSRTDRETVYELYYAFKVTPWCVITPDVQFITNPEANKDARDSVVGGVRIRIDF